MKRIMAVFLIFILASPLYSVQITTDFPNGITTANPGQKANVNKTMADGCAYFPATLEVDGVTRLDGGIENLSGDISIAYTTRAEEFDISTSSNAPVGTGLVQITNTSTSVGEQHYLLELWQKNQGEDVDGDFIICKDSATARTLFTISEAGNTAIAGTLAVTGVQTFTGATGVLGALTMGTAAADGGVFSIIKGTTGSDPTFSITQAATAVTLNETVGDIAITAADDMTLTATGSDISLVGATAVTGNLSYTGGYKQSYIIITGSATLTASSATVVECGTKTEMSVTLPTAVGNAGLTFTIKKTAAAGIVTILTNSTETIDGADNNTSIDAQYDFLTIVSNGTNWVITVEIHTVKYSPVLLDNSRAGLYDFLGGKI